MVRNSGRWLEEARLEIGRWLVRGRGEIEILRCRRVEARVEKARWCQEEMRECRELVIGGGKVTDLGNDLRMKDIGRWL